MKLFLSFYSSTKENNSWGALTVSVVALPGLLRAVNFICSGRMGFEDGWKYIAISRRNIELVPLYMIVIPVWGPIVPIIRYGLT